MKLFFAAASFLGASLHYVRAEAIIDYTGKEIKYGVNRDGLHDRALREHQERQETRKHDISRAKLREIDANHLPHMLNQAPMPVTTKRRINSSNRSHHATTDGRDSAVSLRRKEGDQADAVDTGKEDLSDRIASRLDRVKHAHVRGAKHQRHAHVAQASASEKFAHEFTKQSAIDKFRQEFGKKHAADQFAEEFTRVAPDGVLPPAPAPGPMTAPGPAPFPSEGGGFGTMDEDMGAPEQGFKGKTVEHDNMITMTKDWRGEYGPGVDGYFKICALYPDNAWCRERGYHTTTTKKSSTVRPVGGIFLAAIIVIFCSSFA